MFDTQGWGEHVPTVPSCLLQTCVPGQSLRFGAVLQPGTQIPAGPLQMTPDVELPHSLSPFVSEQPQMPSEVRHCGALPPQREELVPEHCVQAPASALPEG